MASTTLKALTKYPGVLVYESQRRKYRGRPERCFYIKYKNVLGKTIREKIGWESEGITAAYAFQIRAERLRAIRLGDEVIPIQKKKKQAISFSVFMEEKYLPWCKENKAWGSYQRELSLYRNWLKPEIGDKPLKSISPFDLERVKKVMKDAGKAPRTIEYALAVVRQSFNKARLWNVFEGDNPASKVSPPKRDNKRTRFLSPEEAQALLEECKRRSQQLYEICLSCLHTGMRAGEILNLTWADIDFAQELIHIKDPKNRTNRVAYMTPEVKAMFEAKEKGAPDEYIFPNYKTKVQEISHFFKKIVDSLGLNDGVTDPRDRVVFHTLRHTFASWLAIQGTPLHVIKELLGHKSLAMTERYSHLIPDAKRQAVKGLTRMLKVSDNVIAFKKES